MKARNKFSPRVQVLAPQAVDAKTGEIIDDGRTQKHFKDEVDINNILAKYRKGQVMTHVKRAQARFGDFSQYTDLASDMDKVAKAQQTFEMLPATLRNHFKNSIPGFFDFVNNPDNFEKGVELGIFERPKQSAPDPILETLTRIETRISGGDPSVEADASASKSPKKKS